MVRSCASLIRDLFFIAALHYLIALHTAFVVQYSLQRQTWWAAAGRTLCHRPRGKPSGCRHATFPAAAFRSAHPGSAPCCSSGKNTCVKHYSFRVMRLQNESNGLENAHPEAASIIVADFNGVNMRKMLPKYHQHNLVELLSTASARSGPSSDMKQRRSWSKRSSSHFSTTATLSWLDSAKPSPHLPLRIPSTNCVCTSWHY